MISEQSSKYPIYARPYFGSYIGYHKSTCQETLYPYSEYLFRKHDIFKIFILDGGAFLFTAEHLGGAAGANFLKAFHSRRLFGPWMNGETMNWNEATRVLMGSTNCLGENYAWLNRLYFLLPFAHEFFLTKDVEWAELWFQHFESWCLQTSVPTSAREEKKRIWIAAARRRLKDLLKPALSHTVKRYFKIKENPVHLVWSDMQLSWRLLVFIHSIFLLNDNGSLKDKNWQLIYQCIAEHAQRLYCEAIMEMKLSIGSGNHFLHKGVALLYAGILYPELEKAQEYIDLGCKIVSYHISEETTPDGANIESSPSYSHFIARLHLEAKLLLEANDQLAIPGLIDIIKKQYHFLNQIATPSGLALSINDSYHLDLADDKLIVASLMPTLGFEPQESCFFPNTSFAVLRHSRTTLFVDGTDDILGHHHQGKPNIILYLDRFPVLIDCGCCNYDRKEHKDWFASPEAHNILVVERVRGHFTREYKGLGVVKLFEFDSKPDMKSISMTRELTTGPVQYLWERKITMNDIVIEITDRIKSNKKVKITALFHFAPSSTVNIVFDGTTRIDNPNWQLTMRQAVSNEYTNACGESIAFNESNQEYISQELRTVTEGQNVKIKTSMCFE